MAERYVVDIVETSRTRWWSIVTDLLSLRLPGPTSAERRSLFVKVTDTISGEERAIPARTAKAARQTATEIERQLTTMNAAAEAAWFESL